MANYKYLLIIVLLIFVFSFYKMIDIFHCFLEAQTMRKTFLVKDQIKNISNDLNNFYTQNGKYPSSKNDFYIPLEKIRNIKDKDFDYSKYGNDIFSKSKLLYLTSGKDYLIISAGPNRKFDILDKYKKDNNTLIVEKFPDICYDPTNGIRSSGGDIIYDSRIKTFCDRR